MKLVWLYNRYSIRVRVVANSCASYTFKLGAGDISVLLRHYNVVSLSDSKGQWLSGDLCRR